MRRLAAMATVCIASALLGGCGAQQVVLGTEGSYLLLVMDNLTTPNQTALLQAEVRGGDLLQGQPGLAVRFYRDGKIFKVAETGEDGLASVTFTPADTRDYEFLVQLVPAGFGSAPPASQSLLIACRKADTPIVVVDLDKTVVASGFEAVLLGKPRPMAHSQQVLDRMAKDRTIVYLTHRPEFFGPKSKRWLRANGFPRGPMLLSSAGGFLSGSGKYKTDRIADLRKTFKNVQLGIGDKISDARAYLDNGMAAVVILEIPPPATRTAKRISGRSPKT